MLILDHILSVMQVPTAEQAGREGLVGTQLPEEDDSLTFRCCRFSIMMCHAVHSSWSYTYRKANLVSQYCGTSVCIGCVS